MAGGPKTPSALPLPPPESTLDEELTQFRSDDQPSTWFSTESARPPSKHDLSTELAAGSIVDDYRIEGVLGRGGMGTIYAAVHTVIDKRAALKVLKPKHSADPEAVERLVQEARAVNRIGHENIIDVFSCGSLSDGRAYIVMEWLTGETLGARFERGPILLADAVSIFSQISRALEAAHETGIVHRDLKPDNVFLVPRPGLPPLVKLLDFGIAKMGGPGNDDALETKNGLVMGTPAYIAPEQAQGRRVVPASDIYSLGVIMFETILGDRPFRAESSVEVAAMHVNKPPPRPESLWPAIPRPLSRLLLDLLEKEPNKRPTPLRIRAVLEHIEAGVADAPVMSFPATMAGIAPVRKTGRSRVLLASAVSLLIAGIAIAGLVMATQSGDGDPGTATPRATTPEVPDAPAVAEPSGEAEAEAVVAPLASKAETALKIRVDVPRADVYVGGQRYTTGPTDDLRIPLDGGRGVQVRVVAPGYVPFVESFEVAEGETLLVPVALQKKVREKTRARKKSTTSRSTKKRKNKRSGRDAPITEDPFAP